ncbi:hypothetical protein H0H93_001110 [Arthromyces matolae]|nr:hypothetical protein H0H93_001110 [Arthromyces matolae]
MEPPVEESDRQQKQREYRKTLKKRRRRQQQLIRSGEFDRILNLSPGERNDLLLWNRLMKEAEEHPGPNPTGTGTEGNGKGKVKGKGREDPQAMADGMNTHQDSGPSSISSVHYMLNTHRDHGPSSSRSGNAPQGPNETSQQHQQWGDGASIGPQSLIPRSIFFCWSEDRLSTQTSLSVNFLPPSTRVNPLSIPNSVFFYWSTDLLSAQTSLSANFLSPLTRVTPKSMIPKVRLASATPLPLGVAVRDVPTTISDAITVTQDTSVNLPNIPDLEIEIPTISNLQTKSTSSTFKAPLHPTETYEESLLPRGKDDVPSAGASKTKPVPGNVRKQKSRQRQRRDDELRKSGELARIMSLSREDRIKELQGRKQGQPGNTDPVEGKGKEPEIHDPQAMAYMMNTHHDSAPSSSAGVWSWDDIDRNQHLGQFSSSAWDSTHQHHGQPSNHAEWDYSMGAPPNNHGQSSSSSWAAPGPNHTPHQDQQWEGWDSWE